MTAYKIASVAVCYNFIRRDLSRMPLRLTVIMKLLTYLLYVTEGLFSHRQSLKLRRGALLQMMPDVTHCVASINLLQFSNDRERHSVSLPQLSIIIACCCKQ